MIKDAWQALGLAGKILAGAVTVVVVGLVLWAVWNVVDAPRRAREAEMANRTATAYTESSKAAIDTIVAASKRDAQTQKEITDEVARIQQLPEAERLDASLTLLCGLREYRGDARCAALQRAGPR